MYNYYYKKISNNIYELYKYNYQKKLIWHLNEAILVI